jgi:hypothetical protein
MSYGMNFCHQYVRAAMYADKILKGTKSADLPLSCRRHMSSSSM